MRTPRSPSILPLACLALSACASTDTPSAASAPPATSAPSETSAPSVPAEPPAPSVPPVAPKPEPEGVWHVIPSNGGRYVVRVRQPDDGFVRGTPLALDVRVALADAPTATLKDVALALDADMPEHLHGINRVPRIERRPDGTFRVENLYLHMPGWWELFFDVRQGPWTERAQLRVDVE